MLVFVLGTSAEALKLHHVWKECREREVQFKIVSLGQHGIELENYLQKACRPTELIFTRRNKNNLVSQFGALVWFLISISKLTAVLSRESAISTVIVQGDTLSTLVGAISGKLKLLKVVHIEAGLRSGKLLNPFPEEISRRIITKLSDFHLAPGKRESSLLESEGVTPDKIGITEGNTGLDNIPIFTQQSQTESQYAIATIHRTEILRRPEKMREAFLALQKFSNEISIFCYLDTRAQKVFDTLQLDHRKLTIGPRLPHSEFINLVGGAEWVFTDSGGLQEECAQIGVPTFVHRSSTERFEGIGENIVLSRWDINAFSEFSHDYKKYRRTQKTLAKSPSKEVVEFLFLWRLL